MDVDEKLYPTIARLLPLHHAALNTALTSFKDTWPDTVADGIAEQIPDADVQRLFRELAAHTLGRLASRDYVSFQEAVALCEFVVELEERVQRVGRSQ